METKQTELSSEDISIDVGDVSGEMDSGSIASDRDSAFSLLNSVHPFTSSNSLRVWLVNRREAIRSWTLFLNTANFSLPSNIKIFSKRIVQNLMYFQSNYIIIFLLLIAYSLITSPLLLLIIVVSLYGGHKIIKRHESHKFTLLGRELNKREIYAAIGICTLPLFYLVGVGAIMFWALGASFFMIGIHATFYNSEALEIPEENFGLIENI